MHKWVKVAAIALSAVSMVALSTAPASAETDWAGLRRTAETLRDRAAADSGAYPLLEGLTTEVGARLAGSPAAKQAADWMAAKLRGMGFDRVAIETFPIPAWARGPESAEVISPRPQKLELTALGGSVPTPAAGIEAEIAVFPTLDALSAAPAGSLRGKIAVVVQAMNLTQDGAGYGAVTPGRRVGPSEAARKGAVAYLVRSLSTNKARLPHTGALNYADDAPKIPAAALSVPDAELLARMATRGPVRVRLKLASSVLDGALGYTVVADIKGREKPEEMVLISAHLDSWDLGTGAIDDGAGVAIVSSAARLIGGLPQRPRRTVRVVLFGAEEMNWSGAAFAKAHAAEAANIVVASECDFGAERIYQVQFPPGGAASPFAKAMTAVLGPMPTIMSREPSVVAGDDLAPLRGIVPQLSMRQDGTHYFDIHHSADDTFDKVDKRAIDQAAAAWTTFAYLAADSDVDFRAMAKP